MSMITQKFGVALLLALLLHWVQLLPTGALRVQEMHLLQIKHRISVEQVAQTVMEEHL
jgi:hypothetical protein